MDSTVAAKAQMAVNDHVQNEIRMASNKRKRVVTDQGGDGQKRASVSNNVNGNNRDDWSTSGQDFTTLSQQLARHVTTPHQNVPNSSNPSNTAAAALAAGILPQLTVPQPTELSFVSTGSGTEDGDQQLDNSFTLGGQENGQNHHTQGTPYNLGNFQGTAAQVQAARDSANAGSKPAVGSDEWHKVRRDNHKEVERRRRETINEGINELAKIVPGCEKNKGSILQRAVSFITQLRENETCNIEKWTFEKVLTDQALAELTASVDKLRGELKRTRNDCHKYKKLCLDAGLASRDDDDGEEDAGGTDAEGDS